MHASGEIAVAIRREAGCHDPFVLNQTYDWETDPVFGRSMVSNYHCLIPKNV